MRLSDTGLISGAADGRQNPDGSPGNTDDLLIPKVQPREPLVLADLPEQPLS